ncbi:retrovirus-related pol polyprotein from transposon TNT 1-94, partial [Tanacetum coccineum]
GTSGIRANTSGTGENYSGQQRIVKCFNCQGEGHMARKCPKPKRKRNATWFREKVLLVEAQGNGKVLTEEELEFLADHGIAEGPVTQSVITHNATYQADDLDAYDYDCDEISTAKAVLMAILFEVNNDNIIANETLYAKLERYKEQVKLLEERQNVDLALGFQNPFYLKKTQQIRPMMYDGNVIAKETNVISIADSEETLMLEEESRSKMFLKQNFGKRFVPQRELSNEKFLHPIIDQSASSPVKIKAPRELPNVSLVNTSLKKLKYHLSQFDNVVKKRTTSNALTEGE